MKQKSLTVVMYHYVRPIAKSAYPALRGLEVSDFEGQLDYLQRHYNVITAKHAIAAGRGECDLPDSPVLLTFDDGYKDHLYAYRMLKKRGLNGVFFPPAQVVRERKVMDVNKVHYILASEPNTDALVVEIEDAAITLQDEFSLLPLSEYRNKYWHSSRFDTAQVIYVKRMLQTGLPERLRSQIIDQLFIKCVSADECAFADSLYLSDNDLREMLAEGMEIGSHGYAHYWLNSLDIKEQADDIDRSLELLLDVGVDLKDFLFCYPYGAYNSETVHLLKQRGCGAAVTTHVDLAKLNSENLLEIPRLDTNDLPRSENSIPNNWTIQAKL